MVTTSINLARLHIQTSAAFRALALTRALTEVTDTLQTTTTGNSTKQGRSLHNVMI